MISQAAKNQRVVNLVQVVLSIWLFCFGIVSTIIGTYAHISTNHYSSINHSFTQYQVSVIDYGSGANLLITAGVIQVFVAILGIVGSFIGLMDGLQRIGIGFMIAYAVLLLVTSGLNLSSAITAYGGYDDFESGAIELLKRLYLDQIGDSIKLSEPREVLNGYQVRLSCCGIWSYTDYVTSSNLQDSSISLALDALTSDALVLPSSCCPSRLYVSGFAPFQGLIRRVTLDTMRTAAEPNVTSRRTAHVSLHRLQEIYGTILRSALPRAPNP